MAAPEPRKQKTPLAATAFAQSILGSPIAPLAVLPWRLSAAAGASLRTVGATTR